MTNLIGRSKHGYPTLQVYVQPRSAKNKCCGLHDHGLKLMVTAPPVDGKANKAASLFLADLFGVKSNSIGLLSGQHARKKVFYFKTLSETSVADRLQSLIKRY